MAGGPSAHVHRKGKPLHTPPIVNVLTHPTAVYRLTMIDGSLQWLIIAFLFAILGGLVLGARRGRFRGRLLVVMMFVLTIWEFSRTALTIAIDGLNGANYTFDPNTFIPDWGASLLFLTGAWLTWRTVRVVERRDVDGKRFHGV